MKTLNIKLDMQTNTLQVVNCEKQDYNFAVDVTVNSCICSSKLQVVDCQETVNFTVYCRTFTVICLSELSQNCEYTVTHCAARIPVFYCTPTESVCFLSILLSTWRYLCIFTSDFAKYN